MGVPAWIWFVVAAVSALAGAGFLLRDRAVLMSRNRERRRWAALRGWQYAETDPALPEEWSAGAIAYHGVGVARDVVAGSTFTADGRRRVYVFDLEVNGRVNAVIAAVQCRRTQPVVLELWLPSVQFEREHLPELLGPVGQRYAFVSDVATARGLITPDLVDASDEIGPDVTVAWIEEGWVLASVPPHATPSRLDMLLRAIGEVADVIDPFDAETDPVGDREEPSGPTQLPPADSSDAPEPAPDAVRPEPPSEPPTESPAVAPAAPVAPAEADRPSDSPDDPPADPPAKGGGLRLV